MTSWSQTFDGNGNVLTFTDGDGHYTVSTYDGNNNQTGSAEYTSFAAYLAGAAPVTSSGETYDGNGNVLTSTDADGHYTVNTYDANNNQTSGAEYTSLAAYQAGAAPVTSWSQTYDGNSNVLTLTDADGHYTVNTYDGANRQTSAAEYTSQADYQAGAAPVTSWAQTFDGNGNALTTTDADGHYTVNAYDGANRQTSSAQYTSLVAFQAGATPLTSWSQTFDGNGNVLTSTDGDGHYTVNTYDGNNNQTSSAEYTSQSDYEAGAPAVTSWLQTYDGNSNVLTSTDADGHYTVNNYDGANRQTSSAEFTSQAAYESGTAPVTSWSQSYDGNGNVLTSTDADGHYTVNSYDGNNNQTSSAEYTSQAAYESGAAPVTSWAQTFDGNGNVLTSTDGDGHYTVNTFDGDNRQTSSAEYTSQAAYASGTAPATSWSQTFDGNGNVLTSTDADGHYTVNTFDGDNRQTSSAEYASLAAYQSGAAPVTSWAQTFDSNGNALTATDGDGHYTVNVFDGNNRQTSSAEYTSQAAYAAGATPITSWSQTFDGNGNVLTFTDGDGHYTVNTVDGNNRQISTAEYASQAAYEAGAAPLTDSSQTFDGNGNVLTSTNGDGDVTTNVYDANRLMSSTVGYGTAAAATTSYVYDGNGNQTSVTDADGNTTTYTYDANGNVLTVTNALGTTTNTYDDDPVT